MSPIPRRLVTGLVFVLTLAVIAAIMFVVVIVLAGPHSSVLPGFLQPVAGIAAWIVVIGVPIWVARKVWLRLGKL